MPPAPICATALTTVQMDAIVEVDMQGKVVWEWCFFDHVIQDLDPAKANYVGQGKKISDFPGRININLPGRPPKRDWLHCNAVDYNAELGQVVTSSVQGEFYVIDHDRTFVAGDPQASIKAAAGPAGDFLYRFGDPARYGQGEPPQVLENWDSSTSGNKQIGGCHDVHWIRPGLPGAGHIAVFNNGQYLCERTAQSSIVEINPFLDAQGSDTGHYVNPPDAGYREVRFPRDTHKPTKLVSKQIVWTFQSKANQAFFSHIGSGSQRLPNGNTLICSGTSGHLFEVTEKGELVWEYINPISRELGTVKILPDCLPMTNALFRAARYAPDYPAFKGKDLTPKGTITDAFPRKPDPRRAGSAPMIAADRDAGNAGGKGAGKEAKGAAAAADKTEQTPRRQRSLGRAGPAELRRQSMTRIKVQWLCGTLLAVFGVTAAARGQSAPSLVAPGAELTKIGDNYEFTEGPAADAQGNVCFSDVRASRTYRWSPDGKITLIREHTHNANGMAFDQAGNLLACEGGGGRVVSIDPQGKLSVVADRYQGKLFNQPNDLWIDPRGGVYFTDPIYGRAERRQDGEDVYYVSPDRRRVIRVIDDMVRPNGLIGMPGGKKLYVSDHGAKKIYLYDVEADGRLSHKRFFAPVGADGMKLDSEGNVYMAEKGIVIYDAAGRYRQTLAIPQEPTNLCFAGADRRTLFITARPAIYTLRMRVACPPNTPGP